MSLCTTANRLLEEFTEELAKHERGTKEHLIAFCREQSIRQVLQVLVSEPIDKEIFWCRDEIRNLALDSGYISKNHQHLVDDFENGGELII